MRDSFDNNLERKKTKPIAERELPEIPGYKIIDYTADNMYFVPTIQPKTPKEGMMYYDKTDKKMKIYTGEGFEEITSG
jgi:hypothetical protein